MEQTTYHCPIEVAMEVLGARWTTVVLGHLKEAPRRYSELGRLIPDISDKMLTQRLQDLEDQAIVSRRELPGARRHVEYSLTPAGRTLEPALQTLYDWGESWAELHGLRIEPLDA